MHDRQNTKFWTWSHYQNILYIHMHVSAWHCSSDFDSVCFWAVCRELQFNFDTCRSCMRIVSCCQETWTSLLSVNFPFQKRLVIAQTKYEIQIQLVVISKPFVPNWEYFTKSNGSQLLVLSDGLFGWDVPTFRRKGRLRNVMSQKKVICTVSSMGNSTQRAVTVCQFNL